MKSASQDAVPISVAPSTCEPLRLQDAGPEINGKVLKNESVGCMRMLISAHIYVYWNINNMNIIQECAHLINTIILESEN